MGAGTIQTAARAARIGMKFFITAIGAAQFLNAAWRSFLSLPVARPQSLPLKCFEQCRTHSIGRAPPPTSAISMVSVSVSTQPATQIASPNASVNLLLINHLNSPHWPFITAQDLNMKFFLNI
jgi:hypothetical protein